jgi:hypothetical protein
MDSSNNQFEPRFAVMHSGELRVKVSEAAAAAPDGRKSSKPALDSTAVRREARERVIALGGVLALKHNKNILSQYVLQLGRYRGQSFKWVLENDLGWVTGVLSTCCASVRRRVPPVLELCGIVTKGPRHREGGGAA